MRRLFIGIVAAALMGFTVPAGADHQFAHRKPSGPAPKQFAADFAPPLDSEWKWEIGGFGGTARGTPLNYNPVILVHGQAYDHAFWSAGAEVPPSIMNVRNYLKSQGYSDQEVWAFSYNGAGCMNTSGCGTNNETNVPDFFAFMQAVMEYTGSAKVDVVAHSLGVTIVRKSIQTHPELLGQIEDLVLAAGANHGTSSCRGNETFWFGCDEIVPGSQWLADLNSWDPAGEGDETPGPIRYMTIYDPVADNFFVNAGIYDDTKSPRLTGANNNELPGALHLPLARGQAALRLWVPFIKSNNNVVQSSTATSEEGRASIGSLAVGGPPFLPTLGLVLVAIAIAILVPNRRVIRQ
ncbi:MAG TPA: hypothetical protein VND22_04265 [Actinomycetota bacterium]|nr:hypothetical protein [Actinomycetota bacterium]